jgi:hypothetical protein
VIGNSHSARAIFLAATLTVFGMAYADEPDLRLRATVAGAKAAPLSIEVLRWSTVAERAPLLAALAPPPPPPPPAAGAAPAAPGRGGRAGRGGRGAAPPLSTAARLSAAVKAAPTVGFIWGDGPTGYGIKYAWREMADDNVSRVVLITDRRVGAHSSTWPQAAAAAADAEFTVLELRFDGKGTGAGKASSTTNLIVHPATQSLRLEAYAQEPVSLEVSR